MHGNVRLFIKHQHQQQQQRMSNNGSPQNEIIVKHGNGSDSGLNSPEHLTEDDEWRPDQNGENRNGTALWKAQLTKSVSGPKTVIVNESVRKVFLGGYRNTLTEKIYHHAFAQTDPNEESLVNVYITKTSRQTQTVCVQHRSQQTPSTKACQTDRPDLHLSSLEDKIMEARVYTTADQTLSRTMRHVVVIQTLFRSYRARKMVSRMMAEKGRSTKPSRRAEVVSHNNDVQSRIFNLNKRITSKQDLEDVVSDLDSWKRHKLAEIKSCASLTGSSKREAFLDIVRKETQILAQVDKDRRLAARDKRHRTTRELLKQLEQPKVWHGIRGDSFQVVTPFVSKCRKLQQFHHDLEVSSRRETPVENRMEIIESLGAFLAEENSEQKLGADIIRLIEREKELLARGTLTSSVSALRQRITGYLLQYIFKSYLKENTSESKDWFGKKELKNSALNRCPSCCHYWPTRDYILSAAATRLASKCRACRELDNNGQAKFERGIYRHHLRWIRNEEQRLGFNSGIAFILQETDVHYLVDKIWHRRSALSEVDDPYDLVLCRWHPDRAWSPWNCVLLTDNEAQVHRSMGIVEENYGIVFVQKVRHKQALGRRHFGRIPEVAGHFPKLAATSLLTSLHIAVKPVNTTSIQ